VSAEEEGLVALRIELLLDELGPELTSGPQLGNLHEELLSNTKEERKPEIEIFKMEIRVENKKGRRKDLGAMSSTETPDFMPARTYSKPSAKV